MVRDFSVDHRFLASLRVADTAIDFVETAICAWYSGFDDITSHCVM
jgi:hypothetical protein